MVKGLLLKMQWLFWHFVKNMVHCIRKQKTAQAMNKKDHTT